MNHIQPKAQWNHLKSEIKARWPLLTEDDIQAVDGRVDELCTRIHDRYRVSEVEARRQFAHFAEGMGTADKPMTGRQQGPQPIPGQSSPGLAQTSHHGAPAAGTAERSESKAKVRETQADGGS